MDVTTGFLPSLHGNHQVEKERSWRNRKNGKDIFKRIFMLRISLIFCVLIIFAYCCEWLYL